VCVRAVERAETAGPLHRHVLKQVEELKDHPLAGDSDAVVRGGLVFNRRKWPSFESAPVGVIETVRGSFSVAERSRRHVSTRLDEPFAPV
jgi:hypothetical protein